MSKTMLIAGAVVLVGGVGLMMWKSSASTKTAQASVPPPGPGPQIAGVNVNDAVHTVGAIADAAGGLIGLFTGKHG